MSLTKDDIVRLTKLYEVTIEIAPPTTQVSGAMKHRGDGKFYILMDRKHSGEDETSTWVLTHEFAHLVTFAVNPKLMSRYERMIQICNFLQVNVHDIRCCRISETIADRVADMLTGAQRPAPPPGYRAYGTPVANTSTARYTDYWTKQVLADIMSRLHK